MPAAQPVPRWNVDAAPRLDGTAPAAQPAPRWNVDAALAERLTSDENTRAAEPWGSWATASSFLEETDERPTIFYDTRSGAALFRVTLRQRAAFLEESEEHGWPSFRSEHVVDARRLAERENYELASSTGSHLGHRNSDERGVRYCVNLACVAGWDAGAEERRVVVNRRGATARARPALDSEAAGVIPKGTELAVLGDAFIGAKRRVFAAVRAASTFCAVGWSARRSSARRFGPACAASTRLLDASACLHRVDSSVRRYGQLAAASTRRSTLRPAMPWRRLVRSTPRPCLRRGGDSSARRPLAPRRRLVPSTPARAAAATRPLGASARFRRRVDSSA